MHDAIAYIRVSSEEQADSGLGLEVQRQRIAAYCAMKELHLAEVFADPGISGGKPLACRPAGLKLLVAANKSKAFVIVAKVDRLFRSVAANVIADFDKKGIQLVAIAEAFDMSSPYGRAMAQMARVFAELERAMIRERTRSAMSVKRSRGERISGHALSAWEFGRGRLDRDSRASHSHSVASSNGWMVSGPKTPHKAFARNVVEGRPAAVQRRLRLVEGPSRLNEPLLAQVAVPEMHEPLEVLHQLRHGWISWRSRPAATTESHFPPGGPSP